jgi:hypothetical protein
MDDEVCFLWVSCEHICNFLIGLHDYKRNYMCGKGSQV